MLNMAETHGLDNHMARVKRLTATIQKKTPWFSNQIAREFLTMDQVNMHRINSPFRLHRKTFRRLKSYGLQGRNSKHTHAEGWRAFQSARIRTKICHTGEHIPVFTNSRNTVPLMYGRI